MPPLIIQPGVPPPERGAIKRTALSMKVGDMVECPPIGKTPSNNYTSRIHRYLVEAGFKARSERTVIGTGRNKKVVIRTWRIA